MINTSRLSNNLIIIRMKLHNLNFKTDECTFNLYAYIFIHIQIFILSYMKHEVYKH